MFDITFFNFSKKENSTARPPAGSGTTLKCAIKTPSSILSPVVEVSGDLFPGNQYPTWNYAHIPAFNGRRYFVTNKVYDRGIWEISLAEDVLASYRTTISNMSGYVTRASAESDGWLVDKFYPVRSTYKTDNILLAPNEFVSWGTGCVAVNVIDSTATDGYTTYLFTIANFATFLQKLSTDLTDSSVSTWDSVSQSIKVTTYEPLRYIGSVLWFPHSVPSGIGKTSFKLGNYTVSGILCTKASFPTIGTTYEIRIPRHPQASSRGQYMNLAPFSEYTLDLGPFGNIKLDTTGLNGQRYLRVVINADINTGSGRAVVYGSNSSPLPDITDDVMLANVVCQYGVPLRINSLNSVTAGSVLQTAGGAAAVIGGIVTGDIGGAFAGFQAAVGGIESMAKGSVDSVGSTGSITDHMHKKVLYCRFFYAADEDNAENGRPLCKYRRLGSLPGFIQVQKGNFNYEQATKAEVSAVNSYLEGGFYFE